MRHEDFLKFAEIIKGKKLLTIRDTGGYTYNVKTPFKGKLIDYDDIESTVLNIEDNVEYGIYNVSIEEYLNEGFGDIESALILFYRIKHLIFYERDNSDSALLSNVYDLIQDIGL